MASKVPYATPLIFKLNFNTKIELNKIFRIDNKTIATLEIFVFCNPINKPTTI